MRTSTGIAVSVLGALLARGAAGAPPLYDAKTVETVEGRVTRVEQVKQGHRPRPVTVATLESDGGSIAVRLGPAWYAKQQGLEVAKGDRLKVKGSRVLFAGKPAILAAQVTKGEKTVTLRDASGEPQWRRSATP